MDEKIKEIIKFVAENYEYETEYDGRMEPYCFFCNRHEPDETNHEKDCLYLKAKKILAKEKTQNE